MPKTTQPGKLPPWKKHAPKPIERQTPSKIRQTAKASGLKTRTKA